MKNSYLISAYCCADALRILSIVQPDAILLDIDQPLLNGYDILTKIKADEFCQEIPVFILTNRIAHNSRNLIDEEVDGVYKKPNIDEEYSKILSEINNNLSSIKITS